jgi:hypothetical protein
LIVLTSTTFRIPPLSTMGRVTHFSSSFASHQTLDWALKNWLHILVLSQNDKPRKLTILCSDEGSSAASQHTLAQCTDITYIYGVSPTVSAAQQVDFKTTKRSSNALTCPVTQSILSQSLVSAKERLTWLRIYSVLPSLCQVNIPNTRDMARYT